MHHPLVSVAMCTYNGEKFLREQLDSILNQTYKNLEIVIVDDGSTDHTVAIIEHFAERDNRLNLFKNERNLGFNKNFEKALNLTSGEYIAVSDQDDIWLEDKIHLLLENIKDNWLVFSNSAYIGGERQGQLLNNFKLPKSYKGILLRNHVTGHTVLLRRELLDYAVPFPEKGYYDWWMGFVASYHKKLAFLNTVLTKYRVHSDSVVQSRIEAGEIEKKEHQDTMDMLDAFSAYRHLEPRDKIFIDQLKELYRFKGSKEQSGPLVKLIAKHYSALFPNRKPWKVLTKHFFARKFSNKL
jgi:glycosyltransferase involved in cell wall biosynthesis